MGIRKPLKGAGALEGDLDGHDNAGLDEEDWAGVSFVNGFITAVVVSPDAVDTAGWLSFLLDVPPEELSKAELKPARELLKIEYQSILDSLAACDGSYSPFFWDDADGNLISQDWAEGFLAGMELSKNAWDRALENEDLCAGLFLVFTLLRDEEFLASIEEEGGLDQEDCVLAAQEELPLVVQGFFEASPLGEAGRKTLPDEPGNNVGRNDPCPCGSGKKYKKCCLN
jgi:uncharacterized protein